MEREDGRGVCSQQGLMTIPGHAEHAGTVRWTVTQLRALYYAVYCVCCVLGEALCLVRKDVSLGAECDVGSRVTAAECGLSGRGMRRERSCVRAYRISGECCVPEPSGEGTWVASAVPFWRD